MVANFRPRHAREPILLWLNPPNYFVPANIHTNTKRRENLGLARQAIPSRRLIFFGFIEITRVIFCEVGWREAVNMGGKGGLRTPTMSTMTCTPFCTGIVVFPSKPGGLGICNVVSSVASRIKTNAAAILKQGN
jgi:hypothetical protein